MEIFCGGGGGYICLIMKNLNPSLLLIEMFKTMADRFLVDIAAKDSVVEFPNMFALEEWVIKGDTLFNLKKALNVIYLQMHNN